MYLGKRKKPYNTLDASEKRLVRLKQWLLKEGFKKEASKINLSDNDNKRYSGFLYHGTPDLQKEGLDLTSEGVGVLYTFEEQNKKLAELWAIHHSENTDEYGKYGLKSKPGYYKLALTGDAVFADLIDFSNYGEKENLIKEYLNPKTDKGWASFIYDRPGANLQFDYKEDDLFGPPKMFFDAIDYNMNFINYLRKNNIDAIRVVDGLDEIHQYRVPVVIITNPNKLVIVDRVELYEGPRSPDHPDWKEREAYYAPDSPDYRQTPKELKEYYNKEVRNVLPFDHPDYIRQTDKTYSEWARNRSLKSEEEADKIISKIGPT